MKKLQTLHCSSLSLVSLILVVTLTSWKSDAPGDQKSCIAYTISMDNPNNHYFHVSMVYSGLKEISTELKMPAWTPGYYMIMDYSKYVIGFKVTDKSGKELKWEKTEKNRWKIGTEKVQEIEVSYDVFAFRTSVADSYLDDGRGFISPTGVFMYPAGKKDNPVTVTLIPYEKFTRISTGLDVVPGKQNTFYAPDFDVLYDCPILAGNQEILTFETGGIPYTIAAENLGKTDRQKLTEAFKKIVETATSIIGEVPYRHYTFIIMDKGMGGLEHTNSMAVFSNRYDFDSTEVQPGWLSFIAHEFFHLYNVKTIRPVELGPFDYDRENYTKMLWLSEGITVYYENLILNRAGFFTRDDVLRELRTSILNYENIPGHLFQSVAASSFDTWMLFFNRSENASNTTISYYDKGCTIGLLLDLSIRHGSDNRKSLDDVMRILYQVYYKEKKRGFTGQEFRDVCEKAAGCSLSEIFDVYIPTTQDLDYNKYFGYAGLSIDTKPVEVEAPWFGANTREEDGNLIITGVEWNSPAYNAGLSPRDNIKEVDCQKASGDLLKNILNNSKKGSKVVFTVSHRDITNNAEVVLGTKITRSFRITPLPDPTPEQVSLIDKWLKQTL